MEVEVKTDLTPDEVATLDEERIDKLNEAGINEEHVLGQAKESINNWNNYFNENLARGKDDMNFVVRDQWTAVERSEFSRLFKPAMTFNKLYDTTKKVVGEQRKNKPDLLVRSLTGRATQEQINLRADLVRTISYQSQNDLIYQQAFTSALLRGFGAFQLSIDYESPRSFNKIIKFDIINDPSRAAFDPTAMKPHKGDGNYCSRSYVVSKEEFAATYPFITNPTSYTDPRTLLDFLWETRETVVVADYYQKEWYSTMLYRLSNGLEVTKEEWEDLQKEFALYKNLARDAVVVGGIILDEIPKIVAERKTQDYHIMHYRLIKDRIIEFNEWPSRYLPIIFVDGDSQYIDGQQYTRSFIHEAKDAQRFVNYVGSEIAAEIKNRRREQWLGTPDNIVGNELMWRNPEQQAGILIAKPDPVTGQMPAKMPAWDLSPALLQNFQRGGQDIREILGFSEQEELQGRDMSGRARRERKLEGSMSAYVYFDNLNQAIEQAGRVVLDLLPSVYGSEERALIINKKDGRSEQIILNSKKEDGSIENALEAGDYDVEIDTGPSFAVQKEVALEFFQQTIAANPQTFSLIADLWAKNLDVQYMPQIAERFKSLVPPQVLAKEEGKELPPQPPSPQEIMMQQEMQLKQKQIEERAQDLKIKEEKQTLEKARLMFDLKKLQDEMKMKRTDKVAETHKAELDFAAKIAGLLHENER